MSIPDAQFPTHNTAAEESWALQRRADSQIDCRRPAAISPLSRPEPNDGNDVTRR